tara:strand:+ start:754 stop:1041 length:288 start_codon:yes stop_codon:yes gene_type:complete
MALKMSASPKARQAHRQTFGCADSLPISECKGFCCHQHHKSRARDHLCRCYNLELSGLALYETRVVNRHEKPHLVVIDTGGAPCWEGTPTNNDNL